MVLVTSPSHGVCEIIKRELFLTTLIKDVVNPMITFLVFVCYVVPRPFSKATALFLNHSTGQTLKKLLENRMLQRRSSVRVTNLV